MLPKHFWPPLQSLSVMLGHGVAHWVLASAQESPHQQSVHDPGAGGGVGTWQLGSSLKHFSPSPHPASVPSGQPVAQRVLASDQSLPQKQFVHDPGAGGEGGGEGEGGGGTAPRQLATVVDHEPSTSFPICHIMRFTFCLPNAACSADTVLHACSPFGTL